MSINANINRREKKKNSEAEDFFSTIFSSEEIDLSKVNNVEPIQKRNTAILAYLLEDKSETICLNELLEYNKPSEEELIHTTVGVYPGDVSYKVNGVRSSDLEDHITYNKTRRPGRAFILNGELIHLGYFKESDREALERKFRGIKKTNCTSPYE